MRGSLPGRGVRNRAGRGSPLHLSLVLALALVHTGAAAAPERDPFQGDTRLQKPLTIRVSRMPIADLLPRIGDALDVRLSAEGDDVADQKLDLFTHGEAVSGAEILAAIVGLLNAECPPRGYRWDRLGRAPNFRYVLVRDVASRQWEAQQASAAEARLPQLLRQQFAELGREPFRPETASRTELPSMRKLLTLLAEDQFARLCAERSVSLKPEECTPVQKELLRQLIRELVADNLRRMPKVAEEALERAGPLERFTGGAMGVVVRGEAPRYTIHVSVSGPYPLGQLGQIGRAVDPVLVGSSAVGTARSAPPSLTAASDPAFALPPRTTWLMGDVLADVAARARVNLIADDYTQHWPKLGSNTGPRSLSAWLSEIGKEYGFEPSADGSFLRLRNRAWWLDGKREIPLRLLTRWRSLLQGTNSDRLKMLVEIARQVPSPLYSRPGQLSDRIRLLEDSPEMAWSVHQDGSRSLLHIVDVVSNRPLELLFYDRLPPAKQRVVLGDGLLVPWSELPRELHQYFERRFWPIEDRDATRKISLFMRYADDRLQINWAYPFGRGGHAADLFVRPQPADDMRQLIGKPLPDLEVEPEPGKAAILRPRGPALLYVTPAWPRPVVTPRETFEDLKALARIAGPEVQLFVTGATAAELRDGWKQRGLDPPPLALRDASAQRLGARHRPLAIVVDRAGRVTWVNEGFTPGDEAQWQRELGRAGGGS